MGGAFLPTEHCIKPKYSLANNSPIKWWCVTFRLKFLSGFNNQGIALIREVSNKHTVSPKMSNFSFKGYCSDFELNLRIVA